MEGYQALKGVKPKPGQGYCVVAYYLRDVPKDRKHGVWFFIGAYSTKEKATKAAINAINKGVNNVYALETCSWHVLTEDVDPKNIQLVNVCAKETVGEAFVKEQKAAQEEEERRKKVEERHLKSLSPGTKEYYADKILSVIGRLVAVDERTKELEEIKRRLEETWGEVRKIRAENPSFDEGLAEELFNTLSLREVTISLPVLKERLEYVLDNSKAS